MQWSGRSGKILKLSKLYFFRLCQGFWRQKLFAGTAKDECKRNDLPCRILISDCGKYLNTRFIKAQNEFWFTNYWLSVVKKDFHQTSINYVWCWFSFWIVYLNHAGLPSGEDNYYWQNKSNTYKNAFLLDIASNIDFVIKRKNFSGDLCFMNVFWFSHVVLF